MNKIVCLDWDGTLCENVWPTWGNWNPGAVEAIKTLHEHDVHMFVSSCRINPYVYRSTLRRTEADVVTEIHQMREYLDAKGLQYVAIHTDHGKPFADLYVDDKAVWYPGREKSWDKLTPVILEKLGIDGGTYLS